MPDDKPLSEVAYNSLKSMILSGRVKPGERLGERELARRINVSRTPLREALGRLARDGLAINRPGLGYFACEFDARLIEELYEFRVSLEVTASRAAATRISEKGIGELKESLAPGRARGFFLSWGRTSRNDPHASAQFLMGLDLGELPFMAAH